MLLMNTVGEKHFKDLYQIVIMTDIATKQTVCHYEQPIDSVQGKMKSHDKMFEHYLIFAECIFNGQ